MKKKDLIIAGAVAGACVAAWLFWQLVSFVLWMCYWADIPM